MIGIASSGTLGGLGVSSDFFRRCSDDSRIDR